MKTDSLKQYVSLRESLLAEKSKIETRLSAINKALGGVTRSVAVEAPVLKRKKFSAAARAAISAAQRARWAKIKAAKKAVK